MALSKALRPPQTSQLQTREGLVVLQHVRTSPPTTGSGFSWYITTSQWSDLVVFTCVEAYAYCAAIIEAVIHCSRIFATVHPVRDEIYLNRNCSAKDSRSGSWWPKGKFEIKKGKLEIILLLQNYIGSIQFRQRQRKNIPIFFTFLRKIMGEILIVSQNGPGFCCSGCERGGQHYPVLGRQQMQDKRWPPAPSFPVSCLLHLPLETFSALHPVGRPSDGAVTHDWPYCAPLSYLEGSPLTNYGDARGTRWSEVPHGYVEIHILAVF